MTNLILLAKIVTILCGLGLIPIVYLFGKYFLKKKQGDLESAYLSLRAAVFWTAMLTTSSAAATFVLYSLNAV